MNLAYAYGQKLAKTAAEPWSVLRTGLTHGAISAAPGAALGGAIGYATAPKDYTRSQRLSRAGKGALIGGATTGLAGGGASAFMQRDHLDSINALKQHADPNIIRSQVAPLFSSLPDTPQRQQMIEESILARRNTALKAINDRAATWAY